MLTFDHYGLHWIEGDIALLVQDQKVDHVLGVPVHYDVTVTLPRRGLVCPHSINLDEAAVCEPTPADPLFKAMLPVPKEFGEQALFLEDTNDNKILVRELLRLSSSKGGEMKPLWMAEPHIVAAQLQLTNLSPLVLFGYDATQMLRFQKIIQASFYAPRRLIFLGPSNVVLRSEVIRHSPSFGLDDVSGLPLESIGAQALKETMWRK